MPPGTVIGDCTSFRNGSTQEPRNSFKFLALFLSLSLNSVCPCLCGFFLRHFPQMLKHSHRSFLPPGENVQSSSDSTVVSLAFTSRVRPRLLYCERAWQPQGHHCPPLTDSEVFVALPSDTGRSLFRCKVPPPHYGTQQLCMSSLVSVSP